MTKERLFQVYAMLKLLVLCQVTHKTDAIYSCNQANYTDKALAALNTDIDKFNNEMFCLTKRDRRIIRWRHRGMKQPDEILSTDGTHPDTLSGKWKYQRSISAMCRMAKAELMDRRTRGDFLSVKRRTRRCTPVTWPAYTGEGSERNVQLPRLSFKNH